MTATAHYMVVEMPRGSEARNIGYRWYVVDLWNGTQIAATFYKSDAIKIAEALNK